MPLRCVLVLAAVIVVTFAGAPARAGDVLTWDAALDYEQLRSASVAKASIPTSLADPSVHVTAAGLTLGVRASSERLEHTARLEAQWPAMTTFDDGDASNRTLDDYGSSIFESRLLYRLDWNVLRGASARLALGGLASVSFDRTVLAFRGVGTTRTWDVAAGLGLGLRGHWDFAPGLSAELGVDGGTSVPWLSYGRASWPRSSSAYRLLAFDSSVELAVARRLESGTTIEVGYTRRETVALGAALSQVFAMGASESPDVARFYGRDQLVLRVRAPLGAPPP
jgi:hypothetical protein